jgi:hypothetical protein
MLMKNFAITCFGVASIMILTACSSGGDAETTVAGGGRGGAEYGFITLSITDAPIDYATEVWVQFDGVEFMPSSESPGQPPILIMFDSPISINLLELRGTNSKALLTNEILPTGKYDWVKLKMTAVKDGVLDSYIVKEDGTVHELDMPGGSEIGLTIVGGLEIISNMPSAKTINFDLRKSIVLNNQNEFQIHPAINLVSNDQSGSIEGSIKLKELISSNCSDFDPLTGNAVYLYEDFNIIPDDIDGTGPEPIRSALINFNNSNGQFEFSFGFVPFGRYTATFTCEADLDNPSTDDVLSFTTTKNVNITSTRAITLQSNIFLYR